MNLKIKIVAISVYTLIGAIIIACAYFSYIFLNKNFYQIISQSNEVKSLQKNVTSDAINIENYNKILENQKIKEQGYSNIDDIKNPFTN